MIPTAEDFAWSNSDDFIIVMVEENYQEIYRLMIEFAKMHVKAALEAAANKKTHGMLVVPLFSDEQKESILNAYPESNIQ